MSDTQTSTTSTLTQTAAVPLWDLLSTFKRVPFSDDYDSNIRRFYSPNDRCAEVLHAVMASATDSLLFSIYGEDSPDLTSIILAKANDPAVYVQGNLDKIEASTPTEVPLVVQLRACPNTRIAVGMSQFHKINHLKMVVVDGIYTIGGSMNWSGDGMSKQNNELVIIRSRPIAHEAMLKLNADHLVMLAQEAALVKPHLAAPAGLVGSIPASPH